ncbi:TIM barrel protein [Kordiimonas sp.]|uniref:TIM barrel protein n=1 Tax=Kordiimonas sp. TaxID=1970157 RepID=UPI003A8D2217
MKQFGMTRRSFLRSTAVAGAALSAPAFLTACGEIQASTQPIGVQLYTLRDLMANNMADTLAGVGALGYKEVEFAGYFDQSYADIGRWLAKSGLSAPSAHVSLGVLSENFDAALEAAAALGHKYLFLAWLAPEDRTVRRYHEIAELLNSRGESAKIAGVQLGYHNHEFEFEDHDGVTGYDIFLNETDANLVKFELDLYWARVAEVDPLALIKKHPGRFPCVHIKDYGADGKMVDVGDGQIDFAALYEPLKKAGTQHFFIEHDQTKAPMKTLDRSFKAFKSAIGA